MKFVVEISEDDAMHINQMIELTDMSDGGPPTGILGFKKLARTLLEDVALASRRCGQAQHMAEVLASHGYEL